MVSLHIILRSRLGDNQFHIAWAAFISTVSSDGIPDIALLGIVMGFFVLGSIIGFLDLGKIAGIALLGILGGLSVGARAVLLKNGLLVGTLFVNWIIIAGIGLVTGGLILWKQRIGIVRDAIHAQPT